MIVAEVVQHLTPPPFDRALGRQARGTLHSMFLDHVRNDGCDVAGPVGITSGMDDSVVLIGAAISALKPSIRAGRVPDHGTAIVQPCVRTHNARRLLEDGFTFEWGGYFTNLAILAPYGRRLRFLEIAVSFLLQRLGLSEADVRLRAHSEDDDLVILCRGTGLSVEIDTLQPVAYRHTIGMPTITGRNANFALRRGGSDRFDDVGNMIIFTDHARDWSFVEIGFGDTTILRAQHGLDHVLDCFPFSATPFVDHDIRRVLEDTALTTLALWREGLRPSNVDPGGKLLGKYVRAFHHAANRAGLDRAAVGDYLTAYEEADYGPGVSYAYNLLNYIDNQRTRIDATLDSLAAPTFHAGCG